MPEADRKAIIKTLKYLGYNAEIGFFHDHAYDLIIKNRSTLEIHEIELLSPILRQYPYVFRIIRGKKQNDSN